MHVRRIAEMLALIGLTLWAFWGCLSNPFHFDDDLILHSPHVTHPGDPLFLIQWNQLRQLTYLSFLLNYHLGGTQTSGFHLFNLVIHLANVLGIYLFARLLVRGKKDMTQNAGYRWLPFAAAGVFALHPIQSEAVNYVYQRSTLLAALFVVAALCAFLWSERSPHHAAARWLVLVFFILALAAKESALTLPLVPLAYLWVYREDRRAFGESWRRFRWLFISLGTTMAAGAVWILYVLARFGERTGLGVGRIEPFEYATSQLHAIMIYLRLVLWPAGLSIDHDLRLASWSSPKTWLSLLLLAGLLGFALWLRKSAPTVSFLILGFFIFLAPTSSIIPSADLMFEHRLYLPMITGSILLAWAVFSLARLILRNPRRQELAGLSLLLLILAGYFVASKERTFVWGDNVRLWKDAVAKAPGKARPHYNLGVSYLQIDREKARQEFITAQALRPGHAPTLYNLGWIDQTSGAYDSARNFYRATLKADPTYWQARHNLGNLEVLRGSFQEAMREFSEATRLRADYWPSYLSLGTLQLRQGNYKEARATLETLRDLRPDLLEARYLLAYALAEEGSFARAHEELHYVSSRDRDLAFKERIEELRRRMPPPPAPTNSH